MSPQPPSTALSPHGQLGLLPVPGAETTPLRAAFAQGPGPGLLHLGLSELETSLPPDLAYWRDFSRLYFSRLCALPDLVELEAKASIDLPPPPADELATLAREAPPMAGAEYLDTLTLAALWQQLHQTLLAEVAKTPGGLSALFESRGAPWSRVGRVCFHLAENKGDDSAPFAFLATYSHGLSAKGKAQHFPLGRALQEYAGKESKRLLQLLLPVQRAAKASVFLRELVDSGDIYHPLAWTPEEAFRFLKDIPAFEAAGVVVRVPDWWKARTPPRPQVSVTVGGKTESKLGADALLSFQARLTLDGEELTGKELRELLAGTNGLALLRGKWVEIDRDKLREVLDHWKRVERETADEGISFIEGMRLLAGAQIGDGGAGLAAGPAAEWTSVTAGGGLARLLEELRAPDGRLGGDADPGETLQATLRPYQRAGVRWLWLLNRLGLGGCLADDMGLGKTIQLIALLLLLKRDGRGPSLLVVPASLLGNWEAELGRFAPSLKVLIAHPSGGLERKALEAPSDADVVLTTYGYLGRLPWITDREWTLVAIDEAQAIKNSGSRQTRAVKALKARHRIALTGTPVENQLGDLWSLYDFLCPGLLGTAKEFERFVKATGEDASRSYAALRTLIQPYLLRRLKTDKRIITDLPEKTEWPAYCGLTRTQTALYQQSVEELGEKISKVEGIQRRGVVLSYLMRFKQICNHPSQWLADGRYDPAGSGKFARLRELCEEIASRREKVLVFTQFREMTGPLASFLEGVFGRSGLVLHGETQVKKRRELVDAFQEEQGPPFFVLSLKAGGTGLNLTAASHVIHFDRWWNPAVENQATDRAFRIGQRRNVMVHKFVCRGTVEERIDALIESKQAMSREVLEGSHEALLTELPDVELLKLVSLDIRSAAEEI